jgi:hypothetical protein
MTTTREQGRDEDSFYATTLSDGWQFKQTRDTDSKEAWLPVKQVPSTVHQDLIDNGRYVRHIRDCTFFLQKSESGTSKEG